jgi:periplasmic nitrate reductase NapD
VADTSPTRRDLLAGQLAATVHISSAVVTVLPPRREEVLARLATMDGVEVHHQSASKIVIVLEGPHSGVLGARLTEIALLDGVISANMVFEQVEQLADLGE